MDKKVKKEFFDLFRRKLNEDEQQKTIELNEMIKDFNKKVFDEDRGIKEKLNNVLDYGYLEDYGYYMIKVAGGKIYIYNYGKDRDENFLRITIDCIATHELTHKKPSINKLNVDYYKERLDNYDLDDRFCRDLNNYESYLIKFDKYFNGNIPEEIIKFFENNINGKGVWYSFNPGIKLKYDIENKQFDYAKNIKIKEKI